MIVRCIRFLWQLGTPTSVVPVLALGLAVMLGVQLLRPIHDVDIFWQLKLGELIVQDGLPGHEPFLAGKGQHKLAVVGWLGQAFYASQRMLGGWDWLRLVDACIWLGGLAVVGWSLARQGYNQWLVLFAVWVGWFSSITFASIRPQSMALCCFGLLLVLVRSQWPTRMRIIAGFALLVLWQNLHPSAAVGVMVLAAGAVAEWGQYLWKRTDRPDLARLVLVPLGVFATVLTPAGLGIYEISAINRDRCVWDQLAIGEWLPVWHDFPQHGRGHAAPFLIATATLFLVRGRRVRLVDLLPALMLFAMSLLTFRFVLFWAIAIIPVWVQALAAAPVSVPTRVPRIRRAVALLAFVLALIPLKIRPLYFDSLFPFAGVEALKRHDVHGPVYCHYLWGGMITDACHPAVHPTHDGRYYLFTREELAEHFAMNNGEISLWDLELRHQPLAMLLDRRLQDPLIQEAYKTTHWKEIHADENCVVFVRW